MIRIYDLSVGSVRTVGSGDKDRGSVSLESEANELSCLIHVHACVLLSLVKNKAYFICLSCFQLCPCLSALLPLFLYSRLH
jgi:hypothetical protein